MSEMVSKVAEALAQSFRDTVARVSGDSWEATGVTLPSKEVFERYARAAIEAMRELLEEARELLSSGPSEAEVAKSHILEQIDAALAPSTVVPGERK